MPETTRADRLSRSREVLEALLEVVEDGSKAAALSRELRELNKELESIGAKETSRVDDLAARRAARITEAAGAHPPAVHE